MSDIKPNKELNKKRLTVKKSELLLSLERIDLRSLEIQDELAKLEENKLATKRALMDIDAELTKI